MIIVLGSRLPEQVEDRLGIMKSVMSVVRKTKFANYGKISQSLIDAAASISSVPLSTPDVY